MNTKSIRFRLTFWYSIAFSIAAAIIFVSFYLITRQAFFSQTDTTLATHTQNIVSIVNRQQGPMHQMMIKDVFFSEYSESPGMIVTVMDDTGNIVGSSIAVKQTDQIFGQLFWEAKNSKIPFYKDNNLGEIPMRFFVHPVYDQGALRAVVLMAHPMDVIQKSLAHLLTALEVVFLIFLMPTVFGGYLLARSGMQPIALISQKLKDITSENLDKRIQNPQTQDELEELTLTINNLLDRLHKAFVRERQFIGDVAHELKTPLATQRSIIEVILTKDRTNGEYKKTISEMLIDNQTMTETLKNILDLAWSEADISKNQTEKISLSAVLEELKDMAEKMALAKQIKVEGSIQPHIKIYGEKDKLFRAFLNIIDNSIKYTDEKGSLSITLNKTSDKAHINIKDTGIGISKNDLPHILKRFYRGTQTQKTSGAGLGLAISEAIISSHHGKISIESKIGQGTLVSISFPLE